MVKGVQARYGARRASTVLDQWGAATASHQSAVGCSPKCSDPGPFSIPWPESFPADLLRGSIFWIVVSVCLFFFFPSVASSLLSAYPEPFMTQSSPYLFKKIEAFPYQLPRCDGIPDVHQSTIGCQKCSLVYPGLLLHPKKKKRSHNV